MNTAIEEWQDLSSDTVELAVFLTDRILSDFSIVIATESTSRKVERAAWISARLRCFSPKQRNYPAYGGRGITVCDRWFNSFEAFYDDMGPRPESEPNKGRLGVYSLDRIDVNGHYSCGKCEQCLSNGWAMNCRWITMEQQATNTQKAIRVTYEGETRSLRQWAASLNVDHKAFIRMAGILGSPEKAIVHYLENGKAANVPFLVEVDGLKQSLSAWARYLGVDRGTIKHWSLNLGSNEAAIKFLIQRKSNQEIESQPEIVRDLTVSDWSRKLKVSRKTIEHWQKKLGSLQEAIACIQERQRLGVSRHGHRRQKGEVTTSSECVATSRSRAPS